MQLESELVAQALFETCSVTVDPASPFTFSAGFRSPIYVDCRRLISFPRERALVVGLLEKIVTESMSPKPDTIAGGESAGIPFAAWVAERLQLPLVYVRKKPKEFGRLAQVEGALEAGQEALLVEDLITNAGSKITFREGLVRAGAHVSNVLVVFEYGVPGTRDTLAEHSMELSSLVSGLTLVDYGRRNGLLSPRQAKEIRAFIASPPQWSEDHPGTADR